MGFLPKFVRDYLGRTQILPRGSPPCTCRHRSRPKWLLLQRTFSNLQRNSAEIRTKPRQAQNEMRVLGCLSDETAISQREQRHFLAMLSAHRNVVVCGWMAGRMLQRGVRVRVVWCGGVVVRVSVRAESGGWKWKGNMYLELLSIWSPSLG